MRHRRSTSRSATSSSLAADSSRMRCRIPGCTATGHTRAVHPAHKVGRPAAAFHCQPDLAMVEARSDWARPPPTKRCRPSIGRVLVRRPDRDTTQGSHSRAESMWQRGLRHRVRDQDQQQRCPPQSVASARHHARSGRANRRPAGSLGHRGPAAQASRRRSEVQAWYPVSRRRTDLIGCRRKRSRR